MSTKFDKKMSNFFDVEPIEPAETLPEKVTEIIPHETLDIDLKKDYEIARENFHDLIEKGKDALDDILSIARDSEKGRDFEVAATLLKNVVEANERMLSMHKQIRDISNYKQQSSQDKTTINTALFVGSTTELAKLVKQMNNDVIDGEIID
jgi:hypothetical protein